MVGDVPGFVLLVSLSTALVAGETFYGHWWKFLRSVNCGRM